ncbi:hypothetical protein [Croceicoccus sp. BE223]|uniref:hypothetical protein n=1 Tax=Croceicoccus sp. BE223 TaxID=2817716 RepID=UPI0028541C01|nr:hypothetical protein [Croceicoccus sp. BE223]MDR7102290.1 hypothetical protein [Croceicoccus sp. BE223]
MRSIDTQLAAALGRALGNEDWHGAGWDMPPPPGINARGVERAAWLALHNWEADRDLFARFPACRETSRHRMRQLIGRLET